MVMRSLAVAGPRCPCPLVREPHQRLIALAVVAVALGACQVCADPVPAKPLRRGESSLRDYLEQHLHHRLVPAPMNASAWLGRSTLPRSIPSSSLANWVARSTREPI